MSKQKQKNRKVVTKEAKSKKQKFLRDNQHLVKLPSFIHRKGVYWKTLNEIDYKLTWNNVNFFSMSMAIMMTQFSIFYDWLIYEYYGDLMEYELSELSLHLGNKAKRSFNVLGNAQLFRYNINNSIKASIDNLMEPNIVKPEIFNLWETLRLLSMILFTHVQKLDRTYNNSERTVNTYNDDIVYETISNIKNFIDLHIEARNPNILLSCYYYSFKRFLMHNNVTKFNKVTQQNFTALSKLKAHLGLEPEDSINLSELLESIRHEVVKLAIPSLHWQQMMEDGDPKKKYHPFYKKFFPIILNPERYRSTYDVKVDIQFDKILDFFKDTETDLNIVEKQLLDKYIVGGSDAMTYSNRNKWVKMFIGKVKEDNKQ